MKELADDKERLQFENQTAHQMLNQFRSDINTLKEVYSKVNKQKQLNIYLCLNQKHNKSILVTRRMFETN